MNELVLTLGMAEGQDVTLTFSDGTRESGHVTRCLFTNGRFGAVIDADPLSYGLLCDVSGEDEDRDSLPVYSDDRILKSIIDTHLPSSPPNDEPDQMLVDVTIR